MVPKKPLRILILGGLYSNAEAMGGLGIISDFPVALAKRGVEVDMFVDAIESPLPEIPNLKIHKVPFCLKEPEPSATELLKYFLWAIPFIMFKRIDIVHLLSVNEPCPFAVYKLGTKFVESAEISWEYDNPAFRELLLKDRSRKASEINRPIRLHFAQKVFRRLATMFYRAHALQDNFPKGTDAFFCRSTSLMQHLKTRGINSRLFYIPIGVDVIRFSPGASTVPRDPQKTIFFCSGALCYRKGTFLLVDAFQKLSNKYPGKAELWLAGPAAQQTLEELNASIGGNPAIKILPRMTPPQMPAYVKACDIYVAPVILSPHGPLQPNTLEAMATGKPLIISEYGASRELARHNAAMVFRTGNTASLAEAMEKLLLNEHLRKTLGANARAYAEKNFSWDIVAGRALKAYHELLETNK